MRIEHSPRLRPRRTPSAFTLIELLVVIVVVGILATIAIPRFAEAKTKAVASTARSDLRNLAVAQDSHFNDHRIYTADMLALDVTPSDGVTIAVLESSSTGWSATATYRNGQCAIYFGSATPLAPATVSTVVGCT